MLLPPKIKAQIRGLLFERSPFSEWIVTLDYYRSGPLGLLLLVRDQADIVRENISFHLDHGVDFVIVTDNRSTDGTRDILSEFARSDDVVVVDEPGQSYDQARWVGRMVQLARERFGAKWVIPADGDEFWLPGNRNYRSDLASPANVFYVQWNNMVPVDGAPWQEFTQVGDALSYDVSLPKVFFATTGFREVHIGNHDVRIVPRVTSPSRNIRLYHYPIRSYAQFERKVVDGYRAIANTPSATQSDARNWRDWHAAYEKGSLRETFAALTRSEALKTDGTMAAYFAGQNQLLTPAARNCTP